MKSIDSIKDRISIHDLWDRYGYEGNSRANPIHSPFRDDKKPSFSIFDNGNAFKDHATGESGDQIAFIALAEGISIKDAIVRFYEIGGVPRGGYNPMAAEKVKKREIWNQSLEIPSEDQIAKIATLRGLEKGAVKMAVSRGMLFTHSHKGDDVWVVTDSTRLNAQARRYDGAHWADIKSKAKTLWGSEAGWPIGLPEAKHFNSIALVEGGPDLLAAFHCLYVMGGHERIAPVAILGASQNLPRESQQYFKGKIVRIFLHDDDAGNNGAFRWARQLEKWGLNVDLFRFGGLTQKNAYPVKDLNDFCNLDLHSFRVCKNDIRNAFCF